MSKSICLCLGLAGILCLVVSAVVVRANQDRIAEHAVRDQLIGAWRLVDLEEPDSTGKLPKADYDGIITYTRDGHMSVQIMPMTPGTAEAPGPVKYQSCDHEAYYGNFDIDERAQTGTHHVVGSLVRTLIGKDLTRVYEFSGRQLVLKSSRSDEHWTITWEHF